jgi:hypothetical protein
MIGGCRLRSGLRAGALGRDPSPDFDGDPDGLWTSTCERFATAGPTERKADAAARSVRADVATVAEARHAVRRAMIVRVPETVSSWCYAVQAARQRKVRR